MSIKKYGNIICPGCGKKAQRELRYINCSKKKNKPLFCTQACAVSYNNKKRSGTNWAWPKNSGKKKDEISPFRPYWARMSSKRGDITPEDIKAQWDKQKGLCSWTKLPLKLKGNNKNYFDLASIDRIDSTKPYDKNNIQFVIAALNLAKSNATETEFREFLKIITQAVCL